MNRNLVPIVLIIIAVGLYFTFTRGKLNEVNEVKAVNTQYQKALSDFKELVAKRNTAIEQYNQLSAENRDRLEKMLPDNVDNVRLIIDVNGVASRHGIAIKEVKSSADNSSQLNTASLGGIEVNDNTPGYNTVRLSFKVKSTYPNFVNFLKDLEASLRIMDVSKIELNTGTDISNYEYTVEIKTYWLKDVSMAK